MTGVRANMLGHAAMLGCFGLVALGAALPPALAGWDCRNNRLAWLGL